MGQYLAFYAFEKIRRPAMDGAFVPAGALAVFRLAPLGPQIGVLPHVVSCVSAFLDYTESWSMKEAVEYEHWGLLTCLIEKLKQNCVMNKLCKRMLPISAMEVCAQKGRVNVMQSLYEAFNTPLTPIMLVQAARGGHLAVAQWIYEVLLSRGDHTNSTVPTGHSIEVAAQEGRLEFVELMLEHANDRKRKDWMPLVIEATLENYHMHILKWVVRRFPADVGTHALDMAASKGLLDPLRLLHELGTSASTEAMDIAAMNGDLGTVVWLHENRSEGCTIKAMDKAAGNGHLDIVRYLHQNRTEGCSMKALRNAVRHGHLDIVRYILESGIEAQPYELSVSLWGWSWQEESARMGTTDVLECVEDYNGLMELDFKGLEYCVTNLIDIAAANGHVDIIKYLHSQGEKCTRTGMTFAVMRGHLAAAKWIHENSSVSCDPRAADIAATRGHLEMVRWVHENDITTFSTRAMDGGAEKGFLGVISFLHLNRSEGCTTAAMDIAARYGHFEVVKWLHANRSEGCTLEAINDADQERHTELVEWLKTSCPAQYEAGRRELSKLQGRACDEQASAAGVSRVSVAAGGTAATQGEPQATRDIDHERDDNHETEDECDERGLRRTPHWPQPLRMEHPR